MEVEKRNSAKKTALMFWGIAFVLFLVLTFCFSLLLYPKQDRHPEMVIMGDSIYAYGREKDAVSVKLSAKLGREIWNGAMGGTAFSRMDADRWMDRNMDSMSMVSLSKAICAKDFSVQRQAGIRMTATEYFGEVVEECSHIDFRKVRVLFLGFGMNDYQSGVPLEGSGNLGTEYTFGGAIRKTLTDLHREYPSLRVILLTPTYSWYLIQGKSCEEQDWGGGYLEQYVELEKQLAQEYGVECIDLYHDLYPHETFEDWKNDTVDGVHPNEQGREKIAETVARYLEEHP